MTHRRRRTRSRFSRTSLCVYASAPRPCGVCARVRCVSCVSRRGRMPAEATRTDLRNSPSCFSRPATRRVYCHRGNRCRYIGRNIVGRVVNNVTSAPRRRVYIDKRQCRSRVETHAPHLVARATTSCAVSSALGVECSPIFATGFPRSDRDRLRIENTRGGSEMRRYMALNRIADDDAFRSFATRRAAPIAEYLPSCGNMLFSRSTFARDVHVYRHCHLRFFTT